MRRAVAAFVLLWVAELTHAQTSCTGDRYAPSSAATVGLSFGSDVAADVVQSAIEMWSTCGEYSTGFPAFTTDTGDLTITIVYEPGPSDGGCGDFHGQRNSYGQIVSGTITLWGSTASGQSCAPKRAETLAHELGHVLGLDNSSCEGYIMGPMSFSTTRYVQSAECEEVEDNWRTPAECVDVNENGVCDIFECADQNQNGVCDDREDIDKDPNEDTCPGGPPCSSPLLINLDGGRWDLSGPEHPVWFDIDADGRPNRITWTAKHGGTAFVAMDRNQNGKIDSGAELFGNAAPLASGAPAENGFEALKELDSNGDGLVTAADEAWDMLLLWIDTNHDGVSQFSELQALSSSTVQVLDTRYHWTGRRDQSGNFFGYESLVTVDGRRFAFYDVYFRSIP